MRNRSAFLIAILIFAAILLVFAIRKFGKTVSSVPTLTPSVAAPSSGQTATNSTADGSPTRIYAHNLLLRKGPSFRFYVRWLRGSMTRAQKRVNPSFDDPASFFLDIDTGVLRANVGDINNFLNTSLPSSSPLKKITLSGDGDQIKIQATLHKVIPLSVELLGTVSAQSNDRIQIHVTKINVLKVPLKGLLGVFHVSVSDFFKSQDIPGIQVVNNDVFFNTQQLLPPPHIRGHLTQIHFVYPDLEEVYGQAQTDVNRVEQWRNFLHLTGGTLDFGKLTMHQVDIIMIDISNDPWFDLDLANYQAQLVNGYTRMTPQAGLQIFMPDLRDLPHNKATQNISIEWLKNRNLPPPSDVTPK